MQMVESVLPAGYLAAWRLNRSELDEVLAERFALPLEIICEMLDYCTEEELFDLLIGMGDEGALAGEREELEAERRRA